MNEQEYLSELRSGEEGDYHPCPACGAPWIGTSREHMKDCEYMAMLRADVRER